LFSKDSDDLVEICADALSAFSLVLSCENAEDAEPALTVLKRDKFSLVVKVRCEQYRTSTKHDSVPSNVQYVYVLKRISDEIYAGSEETAQVQKILMPLSDSKRKVAADGSFLFRQILPGNKCAVWSLTRFVPNGPSFDWLDSAPSWTEAQSHSAGEILALLHHQSHENRVNFASESFSKMTSVIASIPEWLEKAFAKSCYTTVIDVGVTNTFLSTADQISVLEKIEQSIVEVETGINAGLSRAVPYAEKLMIHGDFHPGNVLFRNEKAVCVIDWDYAHLEDPLLELAYGLIMFSRKFGSTDHDFLDQKMAKVFLNGYCLGCRSRGGSLHRAVSDESLNALTDQVGCDADIVVLDILLRPYIKLAASLILLWALSKQGLHHEHQAAIVLKSVRLVLSEHESLLSGERR
jgi:hypothetical protein